MIIAEIVEVSTGTKQGRISENDITVYKSLGVATQNLTTGYERYEMALSDDFDIDINMMDFKENMP